MKGVLFVMIALGLASAANSAPPVPDPGKTLLYVGQNNPSIENYLKEVDAEPDGFMLYTSVPEAKGLSSPGDYGAGLNHADALLKQHPDFGLQLGLYMVGALEGILAGHYDETIDAIARWVKDSQTDVYLRIGYEFDLPQNGYDPELYKQSFRYIVDRFRKLDVKNARFVWHSYGVKNDERPVMNWYPGDDYVDWFGVSIFNTMQIAFAIELKRIAVERGKPFMIAESTPQGMWTERGQLDWFKKIFRFIEEYDVEMFCYINSYWDELPMFAGQKWGDARIETKPLIKDFWTTMMQSPRFR